MINNIKLGKAHRHDETEFVNPGKAVYRVTGEKHFNCKLKNADVKVIKERLAAGEKAQDIANDYGIGWRTVYRWAKKNSQELLL